MLSSNNKTSRNARVELARVIEWVKNGICRDTSNPKPNTPHIHPPQTAYKAQKLKTIFGEKMRGGRGVI